MAEEEFHCYYAKKSVTKRYCLEECDSPQKSVKAECPDSVRPRPSEEPQRRMTTEELRAELLAELKQARARLADAQGEEVLRLWDQIKGIERTIKNIQPKPTVPGDGTTGESSKRMRRGGRP